MPEAEAFKSQTQQYDEARRFGDGSLKDRKETPDESEMQVSRPGPDEAIRRKASEHKSSFGDDRDSLSDMENTAWPEWDQTAYNWGNYGGYPGYAYYPPDTDEYGGWGPISRYNIGQPSPDSTASPDEILLFLKGCNLSGPSTIFDCAKEYKYRFAFLAGNIVNIRIDGPAVLIEPQIKEPQQIPERLQEFVAQAGRGEEIPNYAQKWIEEYRYFEFNKYPPDIIIKPDEDVGNDYITITVKTKLIQSYGGTFDGWCTKRIKVSCEEEEECTPEYCAEGNVPTISGPSQEVNQSNDLALTCVETCGPYTWTVDQTVDADGDGFSIVGNGTSATLSADGTACGSVVVTVTDACGASDEYRVMCPDSGQWVNQTVICGGAAAFSIFGNTIGTYRYRFTYGSSSTAHNCTDACAVTVLAGGWGFPNAGGFSIGCRTAKLYVLLNGIIHQGVKLIDPYGLFRQEWICP